ncbi:MAG: HD domain-containing protein [Gammaproteobacteria bacterium]|jgi:(p)ppGpp synthase/HD superfamily hydrolase
MLDLYCWESKFETCYYSERLLKKLSLLNETSNQKINISEVKKAIYYAKKYHGNQKRQTGEPYYSHPLEVAYMSADYRFKTDVIITSILHDTIEDTQLTEKMINYIFGSVIGSQVENLTRIKKTRKISSSEMVKSLLQQKKDDLLCIKYFDRLHNMQTIKIKAPEKIIEITRETLDMFLSLSSYLKIRNTEQNLLINSCI